MTRPRPNVVIRVVLVSCNFAATLADPMNTHLRGNITAWSKIATHLHVWAPLAIQNSRNCSCGPKNID